MKSPYEFIQAKSTWLYNKYSKDASGMLIVTGTIGWTLSAMAQIGAVLLNKKIPDDQKKYLIPQEILDAATNIATFALFTSSCDAISKKLIKSGKLSSKPVREFLEKSDFKDKVGKFTTNIEELPGFEKVESAYNSFGSGVNMAVNLVASVVASNLIAPVIRNQVASRVQKKLIGEPKSKNDAIQNPLTPAPNRLGMDAYKSRAISANHVILGGSMRV